MKNLHKSFELLEPKNLRNQLPEFSIDLSTILFAVCGFLAAIGLMYVYQKRTRVVDPHSTHKIAYMKASEAFQSITASDPREVALAASRILREYLILAEKDHALFETHEEFAIRPDALSHFSEQTRLRLCAYFDQLSHLKYAMRQPENQTRSLIDEGMELLNTLFRERTA